MRSPLRGTGEMWRDHQISADSVQMVDVNSVKERAARHCSGGAVLHQLRNSHVRESSFFSRVDTSFNIVLRPEKEHHRIARHCPLRARLHTGRFRRAKRSFRATPPIQGASQENPAESDRRTPCACCGSAGKTAKTRKKL